MLQNMFWTAQELVLNSFQMTSIVCKVLTNPIIGVCCLALMFIFVLLPDVT